MAIMFLNTAWVADLGLMDYPEAYRLQCEIASAKAGGRLDVDVVLTLEHPPVFTLGKTGGIENLRVSRNWLSKEKISVVPTKRGGNITFHGPGQLIIYPIMHLSRAGIGVIDFVHSLEEAMIRTCSLLGVTAQRNPKNHGVWVGNDKIGSIGLSVSKGVCRHGLALNVNPDLTPFSWINPCGLHGVGVTSMASDLAKRNITPDADINSQAKHILVDNLAQVIGLSLTEVTSERLKMKLARCSNQ